MVGIEQIDPDFTKLLLSYDPKSLNAFSGAIYGLWADYALAYANPAWFHFAKENGGEPQISNEWGLGRSVLDCVSGEVKAFYESNYAKCLETQERWDHVYECSSDELIRRFHQIVYPLGQGEGLLIVNSLIVQRPFYEGERPACEPDDETYLDANGLIHQCAFCRRVKNIREPEHWDWVPAWVRQCPDNTSHTYCPTCFAHYFPAPGTPGSQ
jgi:hypothetical protein